MPKSINHNIRITGGKFRGRKLASPASNYIHPMGDRQRLALFNVLGDVSDLIIADLCAGTGAVGIEALSRGAKHVTFVDNLIVAVDSIKKQIEIFSVGSLCKVVHSDVKSFATVNKMQFDVIFMDPPYDMTASIDLGLLTSFNASLIILSLPETHEAVVLPCYEMIKNIKHAKATIHFYKKS